MLCGQILSAAASLCTPPNAAIASAVFIISFQPA